MKKTRKFNGKTYTRVEQLTTEEHAKNAAKMYREDGHSARVVREISFDAIIYSVYID